MTTHREMVVTWKKDPIFKKEYDSLDEEFSLLREMLHARKMANLTQAEVAKRMGTKASAVARLESAGCSKRHSPSITTLKKYAKAIGCRLKIKFVPR